MNILKNRESGQVMVTVLILLALGSLLVIPNLNLSSSGLKYHQLIECRTVNSYSADSGLEYVLCEIYNTPGAYTETPLEENFEINGRTVYVTANYTGGGVYHITSKAVGGSCGSTTIESYVNLGAGVFSWAIAGKDDVTISNAVVNSIPDPPGEEGNIHSNGTMSLGGPTMIHGDASAAGMISGWEGKVTGIVTEYGPVVGFPGDYSELYKVMAQEGGTHPGNLVISDSQTLGPLYIDGNLTIKPNVRVTLEGTIYVTGTIDVQQGIFDGVHNIVAVGDIQLSGGGLESEGIPVFTSSTGDIRLVGTLIYAVVYSPNGTVEIVNLSFLYGAIGGKTVYINNATIYWAAELSGREDLPGGELQTISYSYK